MLPLISAPIATVIATLAAPAAGPIDWASYADRATHTVTQGVDFTMAPIAFARQGHAWARQQSGIMSYAVVGNTVIFRIWIPSSEPPAV